MRRRSPLNIPGIYTVTNTVLGTVYVGHARNIRKRWEIHRSTLGTGTHPNRYLQNAWNKFGPEAFRFEVILDLSAVPKKGLIARLKKEERTALRRFPDTYNLMAKAAVSAHSLKLWADPGHRSQQSEIRRTNWQDEEYRAQQTASRSATWKDPEVRSRRLAGMRAAWVRRKAAAAQAELPALDRE